MCQVLEAYGFDVVLVKARHVRSVPGRMSDLADCEWLRYSHSVGLLQGLFQPADEICVVRTLMRHRDTATRWSRLPRGPRCTCKRRWTR